MATRVIDKVIPEINNDGMETTRRQKTVIQVVVSPEFRDEVDRAAQDEGLSTSSLIRRVLTLHLQAKAKAERAELS